MSGSAAGTSLRTLERRERFYVMGVGEEIEEVERGQAPAGRDQPASVARKGYRIAGEITNDLAGALRDGIDDGASRARAGRIEKDEVGVGHIEMIHRSIDDLNIRRCVFPRVSGRS